jgi:hypothetical protein
MREKRRGIIFGGGKRIDVTCLAWFGSKKCRGIIFHPSKNNLPERDKGG